MGVSLQEKMAQLTPERRRKIEKEATRLHKEYLTLQQLRKARIMTQEELARKLGIRQASVAQMEKRGDLLISTLRGYVEAMGGKLQLTVEFPGQSAVVLEGFGDMEKLSREEEDPDISPI